MARDSKVNVADAQFKKTQRAEDGRKAMSEYEAEAAAVEAKTLRLKALRLAKEAAEAANPKPAPPPKKKATTAAKGAKKTKKAEKLSDWLTAQKGAGHKS